MFCKGSKAIFFIPLLLACAISAAGDASELARLRQENQHLRQEVSRLHKELAAKNNDILKFRHWLASAMDSGKSLSASEREIQLTNILKEIVSRSSRLLVHISGIDKRIRELLKELPISPARQARMLLQLEQLERYALSLSSAAGVFEESSTGSVWENIRVVAVDRKLETAALSIGSVHGVFPGLLCQSKQNSKLVLRVISVRPWICAAIPVGCSISEIMPGMEVSFTRNVRPGEGIRPFRTR